MLGIRYTELGQDSAVHCRPVTRDPSRTTDKLIIAMSSRKIFSQN